MPLTKQQAGRLGGLARARALSRVKLAQIARLGGLATAGKPRRRRKRTKEQTNDR